VLPSKIFENSAMAKPLLLGVEGEAQEVVESFNAGICFEPENKEDFLMKLNIIYTDKEKYKQFQEGCIFLAKAFDRKKLADQMYVVLSSLILSTGKKTRKKESKLNSSMGFTSEKGLK
jgi:glycosyltransferase involved in cell wall biosynthesis